MDYKFFQLFVLLILNRDTILFGTVIVFMQFEISILVLVEASLIFPKIPPTYKPFIFALLIQFLILDSPIIAPAIPPPELSVTVISILFSQFSIFPPIRYPVIPPATAFIFIKLFSFDNFMFFN